MVNVNLVIHNIMRRVRPLRTIWGRGLSVSVVFCLIWLLSASAQTLPEQIQQAAQGDQHAYARIVAAGFQNYDALKMGSPDTEEVRRQLRRDLRKQRDEAALARGLVVHEWGANLFSQNEKNKIVESAPETTDDLPPWVQHWSRSPRLGYTEILRNPIIYFYAEKPVSVDVLVNSRNGMLTQWWPDATRFLPGRQPPGQPFAWRPGGRLDWVRVLVNPFSTHPLPAVPADSWWTIAREVDAAPIELMDATETFIFYSGVSRSEPLVRVETQAEHVKLENVSQFPIKELLVVHIIEGRVRHHALTMFGPGASIVLDVQMRPDGPVVENALAHLVQTLGEHLEGEGLFPREADAVLRIWHKALFLKDGLRVIYLRPVQELQANLTLGISPVPDVMVRAFITIVECLAPGADNEIKALIADLAAESFEQRESAQRALALRAGLCVDILKAARAEAEDPEVQDRLDQILATVLSPEAVNGP